MSPRPRRRIIPTPALIISYLAAQSRAVFVNDFSAYPVKARPCLDAAAAASGCTGNTVTEMNTCLCGNGGDFVLTTARCIEKQAKEQIGTVYSTLLTSCTDSRTPLGISQAQFLDPDDDIEDIIPTTFATSITKPPPEASSTQAPGTITSTSMMTYQSVAPGGVTVTITRGIEVAPTGTTSAKEGSDNEKSRSDDRDTRAALAAGIAGSLALLIAGLAFLCYRRWKQGKEKERQGGRGGKFAALSSATSLTTMTASSPPGRPTTSYNGANGPRPDTAHTVQMAAGTTARSHQQQQQQYAPESPQQWQNQYGQHTGNWPSPVTNTDGTIGTWAFSPVSTYPPNSTRGPESPTLQNASWNAHEAPASVPAQQHPPHPPRNTYTPIFELPGDETQAVEADSTPIGTAEPAHSPSRSIQSTPVHMSARPTAPAPNHPGRSRQIDDALQISQVELPPPRYTGPSSGLEWAGDEKRPG
ncbi:hypothetical protein CGRA01v4_06033 [Colletotrichum graminicola]|uniref:Extracellular membrane protein CFEM domain-containing protein n=1 Tax=Colletotrichum graminicola (strain M1.001 / M2 / FGSC 10212) TaxID=645133 RepID=E3QYX2_COLGM|nr:uncharacterized protein GLRG_11204 [Colletotrichum graminicola M1.001]EFQ36060.1 hypothetical protein GLRG_11204 [Colletotrichum graminicola M1.001]WDK14752.1 hypothetical protein CGRA01v4_06033 [Colletotrichum graminicola]